MSSPSWIRALTRRLLQRPTVDDLQARGQNAPTPGPLRKIGDRVAGVVFPTNNSGNNRSVR